MAAREGAPTGRAPASDDGFAGSRETRARGQPTPAAELGTGLARAFGGAVFFALPLLMTMEMWWLGFYLERFRITLFALLMIPILVGLSHFSGFKQTPNWLGDVADAGVAFGVGWIAAAFLLFLFNVVDLSMPLSEITGKITLQAIPASFGAALANSELAKGNGDRSTSLRQERKERAGYGGEVFLMAAGAIFFAFNVAPTEEMIVIAFRMTYWHALALALVSVGMMHAFVYAVDFRGEHRISEGTPWWSYFLRFTVVGYALSLAVSAYVLWTFGRLEDAHLSMYVMETVVLGFPASLGAAGARLII